MRCGEFDIHDSAWDDLEGELQLSKNALKRNLLSYFIHRSRTDDRPNLITWHFIGSVLQNEEYPDPAEQLDNLILHLGKFSRGPGEHVNIHAQNGFTVFGCKTPAGLSFIISTADQEDLIKAGAPSVDSHAPVLTLKGWQRYEELKRGKASGTRAFMAMKFGEADLDEMLEKHFKPAVAQTGYTLQTVGDNRKAGLIDDKIRVDIKGARFLVADLTHANNGAYWEAGYAEGLGKPVIYTCRKDVFDDPKRKPHFDTNHHLTVIWDGAKPQQAFDDLKATIRETIPEAKQED